MNMAVDMTGRRLSAGASPSLYQRRLSQFTAATLPDAIQPDGPLTIKHPLAMLAGIFVAKGCGAWLSSGS